MDIAEILVETEQLKKKHLETAQKLAEAKELLSAIEKVLALNHSLINWDLIRKNIRKFLQ